MLCVWKSKVGSGKSMGKAENWTGHPISMVGIGKHVIFHSSENITIYIFTSENERFKI